MSLSNVQYDVIKRKYDEIRLYNSHLLQKRKDEILRTIPAYKELEDEVISTSMHYSSILMKAKLNNEPDNELIKEYHQKMDNIKDRKSRLLRDNGYEADYLDMKYNCDKCLDTGYVDGEKCSCFIKMQVELLYDYSQMREFLKGNNFSLLSYEYYSGDGLKRFENAVTTCKNFIKNFNSDYHNLMFYGTVGTGKSFLSGCIAKELLDRGCSIVYISSTNLFQTISNHIYSQDKETYIRINESLLGCDLLIIDDLGTEMTNEFVRSHLFELINERNLRHKSMIISTNLSMEELASRYSERVFSRICENFELLHLFGIKDIRIQKKLEQSL